MDIWHYFKPTKKKLKYFLIGAIVVGILKLILSYYVYTHWFLMHPAEPGEIYSPPTAAMVFSELWVFLFLGLLVAYVIACEFHYMKLIKEEEKKLEKLKKKIRKRKKRK